MKAAGAPGSGPGKLTTAQQEYVVERLAAFDSPLEVARSVRASDSSEQVTPQSAPLRGPGSCL